MKKQLVHSYLYILFFFPLHCLFCKFGSISFSKKKNAVHVNSEKIAKAINPTPKTTILEFYPGFFVLIEILFSFFLIFFSFSE